MKFILVDRIIELEPGKRVVAQKALTMGEEYLADHFPVFPVMPGVLMLEALVQASAWLARVSLDFRPAAVLLKDARNVTYKSFVAPGQVLTLESTCKELAEEQSVYAARGLLGDREIVKGNLVLRHLSVSPETDDRLRRRARALFEVLSRDTSVAHAT